MQDRMLLVSDALEIALEASKEAGLDSGQEEMLRVLSVSCNPIDTPRGEAFLLCDVEAVVKNISQAVKYKDSSYLRQARGPCVDRIVGIQEFVESREYMDQAAACRPAVMEGLIELFDSPRATGYVECGLFGSQGWGKSYFSYLAIPYMVYKLSCLHNPQVEYDLAPGTSIIFILQSKRYELSKKVLFEQLAEMLKRSPYFMHTFPFDMQVKSELRFPKNIYVLPLGGADTAALGMNVYGGALDELNYMTRVRYSERFEGTVSEDREYDQAERMYTTVIRRMKQRFMDHGKVPGKLLLISSVNYEGDFTDRKEKEAKEEEAKYGCSSTLILKHSHWEVIPQCKFCGEKFLVELGNDQKPPKILQSKDEAVDEEDVIEVPVEYRVEFERDLVASLRDFGGYTSSSTHPFIPYRDLVAKAQETYKEISGGKSLFKFQEVVISQVVDLRAPDWEDLVDLSYVHDCIVDSTVPFAVHIDLASSENAAGLAIGRIYGYKMLPSKKCFDPNVNAFVEVRDIRAPIYMADGVLKIIPPADGSQIDFELVRDLVMWLRGYIYIKWATMDLYQSTMMIQAFRKAGIRSGVLSVDTTIAPYTEVKLAVKDERILLPPHLSLFEELTKVQKDRQKDKVDHPSGGEKDTADAVAGMVYMLQQKEANYGRRSRSSRSRLIQPVEAEQEPIVQEGVRAVSIQRTSRRSRVRVL